jgi:hypothetical protein
MNHNNQDQAKNNGRPEHSKSGEQMNQKHSKESTEKGPQAQGEAMAAGFMQGRAFRVLCAAGAMLMVYRMGRRMMARRRARGVRQ